MAANNNLMIEKLEREASEKERRMEQCLLMLLEQTCPSMMPSTDEKHLLAIGNGERPSSGRRVSAIDAIYSRVSQDDQFQRMRR